MSKNKLKKFDEMRCFGNVYEYPYNVLHEEGGFRWKGEWHEEVFCNDNPIVLELGCGRGEYTVEMGRRYPDKNFIGVDIKGARMWSGAKEALEEDMINVNFLRTNIELLDHFFMPGEVAEIWITFPDPQMKKCNKRLTGTRFINLYRKILINDGAISLKTDSDFLLLYTCAMLRANKLPILMCIEDLYAQDIPLEELYIKTNYEKQWLERGLKIHFLSFLCNRQEPLVEPDVEIPPDTYRSYNRGTMRSQTSPC